jgi:2-polyprenyl-3-methyl-5-hydroxy-6-metoxy-1,4-benzoquinol methylase
MNPTSESVYEKALNPVSFGKGSLKANLLAELRAYLKTDLSDDALFEKCKGATDDLIVEWRKRGIDPKNDQAVTGFYTENNLYCYELLAFEIEPPGNRVSQLEEIVKLLKREGKLHGLDYGSGIGTLGIYLNQNGIHCDLADVSAPNLEFVSQRLKNRGITRPKLYPILKEEIPEGRYDFITAFDVLEHVADPVAMIDQISRKLKPGGLFLFNVIHNNEENTPHVLMDADLIRKHIRGFGLERVGNIDEHKIYRKTDRPAWMNGLVHRFDALFWDLRRNARRLAGKT